jgi:golgi SNAP receptor complex member 2
VTIDLSHAERQRVRAQHSALDEVEKVGLNILGSLSGQHERLKVSPLSHWVTLEGAQRKVLDVMNTLGMSGSLIRVIERRGFVDSIILVALMIATVVILYFVYHFVKR